MHVEVYLEKTMAFRWMDYDNLSMTRYAILAVTYYHYHYRYCDSSAKEAAILFCIDDRTRKCFSKTRSTKA